MRRLTLTAIALITVVLAPTALAKEPTAAQISGPGLHGGLSIGWTKPTSGSGSSVPNYGNRSAEATVMALAERSGFFPAVFRRSPDPMLETRPTGDLGPRYTIVFGLPGPGGGSLIVQDVYPYATPAPVTYTKPGQAFWDGQRTRGGWFVAAADLRQVLVGAGLPSTAPGSGDSWSWPVTTLVATASALLLALILLTLRRRLRPATQRPRAA